MQGLHPFIPTRDKVEYLNLLLQVGFDTLDWQFRIAQGDTSNERYWRDSWSAKPR